jgi:hypothetical protein
MRKPIVTTKSKLVLNKTTLRVLSRDHMKRVLGGGTTTAEEVTYNQEETVTVSGDTCGICPTI